MRLDILVRCINSAFFLSHALRDDVELYLVLQGGEDAPKTLRLNGSEMRYLNPDERSTASLIRNALLKKLGDEEIRSSPGIYVSRQSYQDVLRKLSEISEIAYLKEDGEDIRGMDMPCDVSFVLGDDRDLTPEEEEALLQYNPRTVCLGPRSLHADHCIILVQNELDRSRC
jgi:tRNA (pseudouridine54-N1)-methyltransferase